MLSPHHYYLTLPLLLVGRRNDPYDVDPIPSQPSLQTGPIFSELARPDDRKMLKEKNITYRQCCVKPAAS